MKLDDFLKCKKVRCVNVGGHVYITAGKEYDVINLDEDSVYIVNDNHEECDYLYKYFEPVLESEKNPPQGMELTPEFEAVEPEFKAGDKVYFGFSKNIEEIERFLNFWDGIYAKSKSGNLCPLKTCCHATKENYERLQATFTDIEFERPPTQADIDNEAVDKLAQAMKSKLAKKREQGYHGWETCKHGDLVQLLINHVDKGDPIDVANFCAFLFARGEQLTQGGTR